MTAIHVAFCPFVTIIYYRKKKDAENNGTSTGAYKKELIQN